MLGNLFSVPRQPFLFLIIAFFSVALLVPNISFAAFGASPPFLNATHLVKGAKYRQVIYLVRDNADEALPIKADLALSERIRPWVTLLQGNTFTIPQGTRQFPVEILINVPPTANLGVYSGAITFGSQPQEAGQVTLSLGIEIPINLTIGTDIYRDIKVRLVKLLDIEEGWSPRVYVKFENNGNVPEKFDSATYELFDSFKDKRFAISQKRNDFPEIAPFTTQEFTVDFPVDFHLGIGQYWGSVTFYQGETVVGSQTTIFNVLKRGSLSNPVNQFLSLLKLDSLWPYYLLGIVALLGIFLWRKRLQKSRKIGQV
ncbi:MAG: hypothetical protein AAB903_03285 [Patescibacteria group bacterium]